ncbi:MULTISPECIES: hypothetical protein [unclassified Spirosoma]|uniref:hypothetical protein n=1 Tax=unclassified Spirosoma TaxID=2621999 RepID=UPI00095C50E2|nr:MULTISPECIES: hypothetical protein [unclassified Spirosoma]MBN8825524.1 hypothetical protein [Spirosoma sp.]OJW74223.1 MAG: hypothetical protein BGO59_13995 [Spirosoma sp. 48-14]
MKTNQQLKSSSTANLLIMQELINQELIRRQKRTLAIDERLKIRDLPLRAVTRSTLLLDIKRHIDTAVSVENITIQHLLYQLPPDYWHSFGRSYPKYYVELKDALLQKEIDLRVLVE